MADSESRQPMADELWRTYLTTGELENERRQRRIFRLLPGSPRCNNCYAPFKGMGSFVVRAVYGKLPSRLNPNLCNICEVFASKYQGGAEVELSLLFADVRGSTALSETMTPVHYSRLINRFYSVSTRIMVESDALIDKIIGDQVAAMYVPGFVGPDHARSAVLAAKKLLAATGHLDPTGPWIPLGAGVHTGTAFVGSVGGHGGTTDITVLGDVPNTTARLASAAGAGEILVSDATYKSVALAAGQHEIRELELRGKEKPTTVHVLTVDA